MVFLVLSARLIELQIIKGNYYRSLAEGNRIRRVTISAPRGKILARGGEILVDNKEVKKKIIFDPEKGYEKTDDIKGAVAEEIITEWVRDYELGEALAHISGFLGEVNSEEIGKVDPECIEKGPKKSGLLVGRGGLEEEYNCLLTGLDGGELVEVDTTGKMLRILGKKNPIPGTNLRTSIDFNLQKKVYELMKDKTGAVVVTNAKSEILALYSSPSFDPNLFVGHKNKEAVEKILESKEQPLFNRAISGLYHPGSTFKPVVATAALEEKKIDRNYTFTDPGVITIKTLYGDFSYSNWFFTQYGKTEGTIDLARAIARSTDTFFYKLGELTEIENLVQWSKKFGLDKKTGIDLPAETPGFIPTPEWKQEVKKEKWFLGNTYHLAIGQGDIVVTPLGLNTAISGIANQGLLCRPKLVIEGAGLANDECQNLKIAPETTRLVKEGMSTACQPGGTGFPFFDFKPKKLGSEARVACKTGTAETNEKEVTHAWFAVFAPSELPEIVATVLVEKGGEGAYVAGPIAREIFDYWFEEKND